MRTGGLVGTLGIVLLGTTIAACGGGGQDAAQQEPAAGAPAVAPAAQPAAPAAGGAPNIDQAALPQGVTLAMVQEGQQLFGTVCIACHGPNGTGTPIAPALNDNQWVNISGNNYDEIVNVINTGVPQPKQHPSPMPPKGGGTFDDQQVRSLAAYVYALSHASGS